MASISLKLVTDVTGQPSDAVAWSADGIVTADLKRVVRWVGDQPGTPIAYSTPGYGVPRSITLLPDGVVGVGALRIGRDGTTVVDDAKLAAALVSGDLIAKDSLADPRDYRVGSAAWTADASHLWLGIEQRKAGSRDAPIKMIGPTYRNLVVDAQLATPQEPQEGMAWSTILAAGKAVVTVAGNLVAWPDGAGGSPGWGYRRSPWSAGDRDGTRRCDRRRSGGSARAAGRRGRRIDRPSGGSAPGTRSGAGSARRRADRPSRGRTSASSGTRRSPCHRALATAGCVPRSSR